VNKLLLLHATTEDGPKIYIVHIYSPNWPDTAAATSILRPFSGTTQVSRHQKGKTNMDFTEARDNEWQWHQLGHMQVCASLYTDNHANTPLEHSNSGKKSFDSIRFDFCYRIDFFRFDSAI